MTSHIDHSSSRQSLNGSNGMEEQQQQQQQQHAPILGEVTVPFSPESYEGNGFRSRALRRKTPQFQVWACAGALIFGEGRFRVYACCVLEIVYVRFQTKLMARVWWYHRMIHHETRPDKPLASQAVYMSAEGKPGRHRLTPRRAPTQLRHHAKTINAAAAPAC